MVGIPALPPTLLHTKTAPASIAEIGAVRLLYGYFFQALTQNLARGLWVSPAYAGKSKDATGIKMGMKDHPRICGEKYSTCVDVVASKGSPPHMRGKGDKTAGLDLVPGITPAYAGKSHQTVRKWPCGRDHPRICGEKCAVDFDLWHCIGSPPHMRGKACRPRSPRRWCQDHPRICGEKTAAGTTTTPVVGSPPHMRGKVAHTHETVTIKRITPAYVGKRLKRSRSTVFPVAIVPLFPSVCNKPVVSNGSPAGRDAPLFLPAENAVPAAAPAGPAGLCPASRSSQFPPRIMVISPRP